MKRVLITGGAGFIGSHLVNRLQGTGTFQVTVVDSFTDFYDPEIKRNNIAANIHHPNFKLIESDICDAPRMNRLFAESGFDSVIHLAARCGVRDSLRNVLAYEYTNVRGTYILLEAARQHGVGQFIFGSSSSVYGDTAIPFAEDGPVTRPLSTYAATKLAGEAACHAYSRLDAMRVICLRFFTVYGPRQRPDLAIHKFTRLLSEGRPIQLYGDGSSCRDYTYVDDIVAGICAAMNYEASAFEIINLGRSDMIQLSRLVTLLEDILGRKAEVARLEPQTCDAELTVADITKARRLLGYEPAIGIKEGLKRFVRWFGERHESSSIVPARESSRHYL